MINSQKYLKDNMLNMIDVNDVTDSIINFCHDVEIPVTIKKLQLLLYYVQGHTLNITKKGLFPAEFYAGPHGPFIPEIKKRFSHYTMSPIKRQNDTKLDPKIEQLIKTIVAQYVTINVFDLIEKTKEEDPWKYIVKVYGIGSSIPLGCFENYFCQ